MNYHGDTAKSNLSIYGVLDDHVFTIEAMKIPLEIKDAPVALKKFVGKQAQFSAKPPFSETC